MSWEQCYSVWIFHRTELLVSRGAESVVNFIKAFHKLFRNEITCPHFKVHDKFCHCKFSTRKRFSETIVQVYNYCILVSITATSSIVTLLLLPKPPTLTASFNDHHNRTWLRSSVGWHWTRPEYCKKCS